MRLKKLYIKDYKNLKDFSLDFENGNGLSILIGNNGSGKSNVLEAISGIFAEAYRDDIYQLETDYSLEYEIDGKTFILQKQNGKRKLILNKTVLTKSEIIQNLPSNVIALYSGEDLRLWENFYLQRYLEYLTSVYRRGFTGKMGMYYVNKFLWNIALFVMLLFIVILNSLPESLEELEENIRTYSSRSEYHDYAILNELTITRFYNYIKFLSYENQRMIYNCFCDRYGKAYSNGTLKKQYYPDVKKIKELAECYKKSTKSVLMSPENKQREFIAQWYEELYEWMNNQMGENKQ